MALDVGYITGLLGEIDTSFRLMPEQASTVAPQVDALYYFLVATAAFFTLVIFVLIVYFALRYRRKHVDDPAPPRVKTNVALELTWTVIPFLITMVMFAWGAALFVKVERPPADAMEIFVIGKQWMWKVQHPQGRREINELHVPLGRPIKLTMTSQDVIHDFFVPAFRVKQDVLPGRYTTEWFQPTKIGEYHLFCAEYCGNQHSGMIGRVVVMSPERYGAWLAGGVPDEAPRVAGEKLFTAYGCANCHGVRAPTLAGVYGRQQRVIRNGREISVLADEQYIRNSILNSSDDIVVGYQPIMPSFRGQLTEEQVMQLVSYIKSLSGAVDGEPYKGAGQGSTTQPVNLGAPQTNPPGTSYQVEP